MAQIILEDLSYAERIKYLENSKNAVIIRETKIPVRYEIKQSNKMVVNGQELLNAATEQEWLLKEVVRKDNGFVFDIVCTNMSQLYVPDGTWTLCTEGKKPAKIKVQSQTTVRISGTRLAAVETDRFDGNFTCLKMVMAAALVGALVGAAIALTGGLALGGILAAVAVGSATGAVAGKLASVIPSVCSILTCGSQWTVLHDNTRFEKKKALLQQATLNCLLGGLITIEMKNLRMARDMSMLCAHIYGNGANLPDGRGASQYLYQQWRQSG